MRQYLQPSQVAQVVLNKSREYLAISPENTTVDVLNNKHILQTKLITQIQTTPTKCKLFSILHNLSSKLQFLSQTLGILQYPHLC